MSPAREAAIAAHRAEIDKLHFASRCHADAIRKLLTEPEVEAVEDPIATRFRSYIATRDAKGGGNGF